MYFITPTIDKPIEFTAEVQKLRGRSDFIKVESANNGSFHLFVPAFFCRRDIVNLPRAGDKLRITFSPSTREVIKARHIV